MEDENKDCGLIISKLEPWTSELAVEHLVEQFGGVARYVKVRRSKAGNTYAKVIVRSKEERDQLVGQLDGRLYGQGYLVAYESD